ncbi:PaaX family transcriptional regulator [Alteromonas sp. K632G]|jgi:phenylacetic acid degradation operon negative regulatory protein|uniref:PaaX family transcriptional regulator n=1 Tax=Alteromonas TaxID=226 RepID=UPI001AD710A8|nr:MULTISPECIES: PaaX family transcriptional regulator [Alteromonas]MBO7922756.1 PaaX family transcriptional regulator [Alteromonas sp. K632G]MDP2534535.1 PaaX family transcriptional regulator [Alteromonas stellipolaris]|tara:strand:+ start:3975 stop:4781 length:807 start_codon:yes stop_codon:yes gene_type:complete
MLPEKPASKPVARHLLMKLLGSRPGIKMDAASAVRVGALFGISENNIRVTLTRLQSAKLLKLVERGYYQLGKDGEQFAGEISSWHTAESRLCEWRGDWLTVLTTALAKSDRKATRAQDRALKLMGLKKLSADFYVRPNNLNDTVGTTRERLYRLGLDKSAVVFNASDFADATEKKAAGLWQTKNLEASYEEGLIELARSRKRIEGLSLDDAAKEYYIVGDNALKRLVFDPLLPAPLVNVDLRRAFRAKVEEYDKAGAEVWYEFLNIKK